MLRTRLIFFQIFIVFCIAFENYSAKAQIKSPSEYEVKAAYIFNFAKFVEWPASAFSENGAQLNLYVLGEDPFGEDLEKVINNRKVYGKTVNIRRQKSMPDNKNIHILFISSSEKKKQKNILQSISNLPILTIGETNDFLRSGGIIQFLLEEGRVYFNLNLEAANEADLHISSQLVKVAKSVMKK